ncbi:MAG: hypothetical protein COW65_17130 [Cytophagales bacterium CG18_big_fil_WC_8_21_14_2_50_42_9]|nr:MAG: hypothetical protein COW65_17130 [Cytophagales bacterium CG18_big_fil_WC_8_21_14_2_50_42_9]
MATQHIKNERIDIRVTPEEKEMFLQAHRISGDRTFSGFITQIVKTKSIEIIEKNKKILVSERDRKVFFDAIFSEQEPNQALKDAASKFKSLQA